MEWTEASIRKNMEEQAKHRMAGKYSWKRVIMGALHELQNNLFRHLCPRSLAYSIEKSAVRRLDFEKNCPGQDVWLRLNAYVGILLNRGVRLHTLLVLGSRVKGRARPTSDVDVLIIASGLPGRSSSLLTNFAQKILNIRRSLLLTDIPLFAGIQPSGCCSKEEFLQWLNEFKILAWDAICYGIPVYDDGFWMRTLQLSKEIREKYGLREKELKRILWML